MIVTKDRSTDNKAIRQSAEAEMSRAPLAGAQGIANKVFIVANYRRREWAFAY